MTLQSSGQISFSNITNEFGTPNGNNLGAFRISENIGSLSNLPLDTGIPSTGEIKFSDFHGTRLNVVVDCFSGGTETRANARSKYNDGQLDVVGGLRSEPSPPSGIKVIINVDKSFKSVKNQNQQYVALRTGEYGSDCLIRVDVGGEGYIGGAGGDGGKGGNEGGPKKGKNGNSALGIDHESSDGTTVINNSGTISAGFGGGGGGGGAYDYDKNSSRHAGGGGGGGGAGFPAGEGGKGKKKGSKGENGSDGGLNSAGSGGEGGNNDGEAVAGNGGNGGSNGEEANTGGEGNGGEGSETNGASGGGDGAAIRRQSGITISVVNNGTIRGATDATGVA